MTLTLTFDLDLEKFTKAKIFETYQLRKTSQNILGYYAQGIIYSWRGQRSRPGSAKCQIHLIGYNFGSNCHRHSKLGSYFKFNKSCTKYDLDLEQFAQGQNFGNIG